MPTIKFTRKPGGVEISDGGNTFSLPFGFQEINPENSANQTFTIIAANGKPYTFSIPGNTIILNNGEDGDEDFTASGAVAICDELRDVVFLKANSGTSQGPGEEYQVYTAILTQDGTADPIATVFKNTLDGPAPVFQYAEAGEYTIANKTFDITKTFAFIGGCGDQANWVGSNINANVYFANYGSLFIQTKHAGTSTNGLLFSTALEIRVYPKKKAT